ncbi:MAG: fumarylacetoacetate hydrolase family protein [Dehalococcoidales bacterium]|nr:fumarylacetoacetate hydrolase family protein [Dehalococcoidales bacterium]
MKIVRFSLNNQAYYGTLKGSAVCSAAGSPYTDDFKETDRFYLMGEIKLLPPCQPYKIVALGVNYASHGKEMKSQTPDEPLIFLKPSTSVIGPDDDITYPPSTKKLDYEGELGIVIKKTAQKVSVKEAKDYILGYTCVNDVTARDLQAKDGQWTRAKGFDTFCPIGPCIETELDPSNLTLETLVNGKSKQKASTKELIFGVYELVSFISNVMTLLPGDVIATGTPAGIGSLQVGDVVEVKIQNIGSLKNTVAKPAAKAAAPKPEEKKVPEGGIPAAPSVAKKPAAKKTAAKKPAAKKPAAKK